MQSQGNGVRVGRKSQFPESTRTLRGYDLWLGTLLFLSKNAPSPRFRMNVYMDYDIYSGKLLIPNDKKVTIDKLDRMLLGKEQNNQQILDSENVVTLDSIE